MAAPRTPVKNSSASTTTTTTTPSSSSPRVAALEVTRDNRAMWAADGEINFSSPSAERIRGYSARTKQGASFTPTKLLAQDGGASTLLLSPLANSSMVVAYDTETGTPTSQFATKNAHRDIDMSIDTLAASSKFSNLRAQGAVVDATALSGNMLFNVRWDTRAPGDELVVEDRADLKQKGKSFSCVATTADGHVAVGTNKGDVSLYENPNATRGWKRAKSNLSQLADPVCGIDVSADGQWVVWTTKDYLALVETTWEGANGTESAFTKAFPADAKPTALLCRIPDAALLEHDIDDVHFSAARFDNGPWEGDRAITEKSVVTSSGAFVVRWSLRRLINEYRALQKAVRKQRDAAADSDAAAVAVSPFVHTAPRIWRKAHSIVDKLFQYGEDTLVTALTEEIDIVKIVD